MTPTYFSTSEAYLGVLHDLLSASQNPDSAAAPRGRAIHEILAYQFTVKQPFPGPVVTASPERNKIIAEYLDKEVALYDSGTLQGADFGRASKFWLKLENPDGTINSNYGAIIKRCDRGMPEPYTYGRTKGSRWDWAVESLLADKDSRQAVIHISSPRYLWTGNKDQVCTMYLQFFIRGDKLHLHWNMRSNDVVKGLVYDISYAILLQERMLGELSGKYQDLHMGSLTWFAGSMHLYDNDIPVVKEMLGDAVL